MKIMGKVFLGLVILIILLILESIWFTRTNSKYYGDNKKILKSEKANVKKVLLVYQPSRGKLTDKIAEQIAKGMNDAGCEVTVNNPGKHMPKDISQYSIVVFGSPIYMGQTSSILSDYMKSINNFNNCKILLFVTGAQFNNDELNKMEKQLGNKKASEKVKFKNNKQDESRAYEIGKRIAGE